MVRYEIGCLGNEYWSSFSCSETLEGALKIYRSEIKCCLKNLFYGPFVVYIKKLDSDLVIRKVNFDINNYDNVKDYIENGC